MPVVEFSVYVLEGRKQFRRRLEDPTILDKMGMTMKEYILEDFRHLTNKFEEETMIENYREEFEDYLRTIVNEEQA